MLFWNSLKRDFPLRYLLKIKLLKPNWITKCLLLLTILGQQSHMLAQSRTAQQNDAVVRTSQIAIQNDVLGHGYDIRFIDPYAWGPSSKGKALVTGTPSVFAVDQNTDVGYHFVTNPSEFESKMLQSDSINKPFLAINSAPYFKPLKQDGSDKLLFVYTEKRKAIQKASLQNSSVKRLDSALLSDFSRLGRDITPEGFIHRYGTHVATAVTYGGIFLRRNLYTADDFIYSPYTKDEFKKNVIADIEAFYNRQDDADPYINTKIGDDYSVGGNTSADWYTQWEASVDKRAHPIDVKLQAYTELLRNVPMPGVEDKSKKIELLDSVTRLYQQSVKKKIQKPLDPIFYTKYSLRFKQKLTQIVKTSVGRDTEDPNDYTGDIFFGGFSKDDAILKQLPLVEYGGIRLETLITDEVIDIDRNVIITIKPEDLNRGYVSVWDDTKKLFKSKDRKTLRVSGTREAKTVYKDALLKVVQKDVELETVDKDVYNITYTLELLKDKGYLENTTTTYNYVLDTELVAAAAVGDIETLTTLFNQNGNPTSSGIIKAILTNNQSAAVLNFVIDNGVIPTTEDLDIAFEPEYYDSQKVLILLERGAKPKNNMIFKAVAYKDAHAIYALFREGAEPRNNDLAQALKIYHYPTVKALMSEEFEEFEAGKNELLLAAANNDEEMASKFIQLGAIADAYILEQATQFDNEALKNVIVPVTEASGETLEVVARINDTELFDYFVKKNAKLEDNTAANLATDNQNAEILDLALKNGGEATEALDYAIEKDFKPGIEVSLKNRAKPEAVFAYAVAREDAQLFEDALIIYEGSPEIALKEAVKQDKVTLAETVINLKREDINPSKAVAIAVSNQSLPMVQLLVTNDADPNEGMTEAIDRENVAITTYLIQSGAQTLNPAYIQEAVKKENLELSKVLIEKGTANVDDAIVAASQTANVEITEYLLEKGATPTDALQEAMETKNEDIILLLLDKSTTVDPNFMATAARKGNAKVVASLLQRGLDPQVGFEDALRYKQAEAFGLLLENGAQPTQESLQTAVSYNFVEGVALLIANGIDPTVAFSDGQYPLHMIVNASNKENFELLRILLEAGASINVKNRNGETPLHLAIQSGMENKTMIDALIDKGAALKAKTNNGDQPIDYALEKSLKSYLKKVIKNRNS